MPYRAELKRPDLKGHFPCSVCGKIFCHSSSLSRHRMQAHFKSYTCAQCNQQISSNETLRSHMFRVHAISRMFMCRCCNWAFPDKTSLNIHTQTMLKSGRPGEVAVLARSSDAGGDRSGTNSPHAMSSAESLLKLSSGGSAFSVKQEPSSGIYPLHETFIDAVKKQQQQSPLMMPPMSNLLDAFRTNNPFMPQLASQLAAMHAQLMGQVNSSSTVRVEEMPTAADDDEINVKDELDEENYLEINNIDEEEDEQDETMEQHSDSAPLSAHSDAASDSEKLPSGSSKRKATRPQQLMEEGGESARADLAMEEECMPIADVVAKSGAALIMREQPSPTVSDSHTSSGGSSGDHHALEMSPQQNNKCYECQEAKGKLRQVEQQLQTRNDEAASMMRTISELQKQIVLLVQTCKRNEMQAMQAQHLANLRSALHLPSMGAPPAHPAVMPTAPTNPLLSQMASADHMKRFIGQFIQNSIAGGMQPSSHQ